MDRAGKRAAISAYKERKSAAGVFAVRCEASAEAWVGGTPTLDTVQTRIWFSLRHGSSRIGAYKRRGRPTVRQRLASNAWKPTTKTKLI